MMSLILVIALTFSMGFGGTSLPVTDETSVPAAAAPIAGTAETVTDTAEPVFRYEGPGFDTPEAAITCYLEGLKNLDFEQMLSAFAWETQISHYDFNAYYDRIKAYMPSAKPRMPSVNDFMLSANLHELRSAQIDAIYRSLEVYILSDDYPNGKTIALKEDGEADAFLQKFDNGRLEKLTAMTNIRFVSPDTVTNNKFSMERNQQNFVRQSAHYGADEVVNIVALASVGDETLYCCPTVARYGGRWYLVSVSSFTSMILGVSVDYQAFACGKGLLSDIIQ